MLLVQLYSINKPQRRAIKLVFTARRYASAVYAVVVCPSVCLSQAGAVPKRLNVGSRKPRHTTAEGLWFSDPKDLGDIPTGPLPIAAPNSGGVGSNIDLFYQYDVSLYRKNGAR